MPLDGLRDADRQPRRRHAAGPGASCATQTSCSPRTRRHTRILLDPSRDRGAARLLPRAQRGGARRGAPAAAAGGRADRARLGCGAAGHLGSGRAARAGRARRRRAGDGAARPVGRRDGARRERARVRAVHVRRLPAAARGGARCACGTSWPRGRWPVVAFESAAAAAGVARARSRRSTPEREVAVCRELTKRFEEVVRGSAAELAERVSEAAEGRDHARARAGSGARPRRREPRRRRGCRARGARERRAGRRRGRGEADRRLETTSTARSL